MKKRILSLLLVVCIVCALLPICATAATLEETTFAYAYDAYRTPSFPYGMGSSITAYSLGKPLDADGNHYSSVEGTWTLTKAGTYGELNAAGKANSALSSIIRDLDNHYSDVTSENRNEVIIHQLKRNGEHVSYGIVIAYDIAAGNVVFIGDTYSSGACYLLSNSTQSGDVKVVAGKVANEADGANTCAIALNQSGTVTFTGADVGYAEPPTKTATIINSGNIDTGDLTIALSGANADSFTLSKTTCNLVVYGTESFTIQPKLGLNPGTYTATVTVSGANMEAKSFDVSFRVFAVTYTVIYKVGDEVVSTQTIEHGQDAAAPAIPAKDGYTGAWDHDGKNITADTEIKAVYTTSTYTVTYKADGVVVATQTVENGKDATAPAIPEKSGYTATWDHDGKNITADTEITAIYAQIAATPATGDTFGLGMWMTIMTISAAAFAALLLLKKRNFA